METRLSKYWTDYCRVRNKVKNMTKYFRKQKEKSISSNVRNNLKAFWKYDGSKINKTNSIHVSIKVLLIKSTCRGNNVKLPKMINLRLVS